MHFWTLMGTIHANPGTHEERMWGKGAVFVAAFSGERV